MEQGTNVSRMRVDGVNIYSLDPRINESRRKVPGKEITKKPLPLPCVDDLEHGTNVSRMRVDGVNIYSLDPRSNQSRIGRKKVLGKDISKRTVKKIPTLPLVGNLGHGTNVSRMRVDGVNIYSLDPTINESRTRRRKVLEGEDEKNGQGKHH